MNAEIRCVKAKACEARNAYQIPLLATHRRTQDRDRFTLARAVAELVEDLRNDDRFGGRGIHREPDRCGRARASPDQATNDDEIARAIEARDLHGTMKRGMYPRISPVQKQPTSMFRARAALTSGEASRRCL